MIPSKFVISLFVVLAIVLMWTQFCRQMDFRLNQARVNQDNILLPGCRWRVCSENLPIGKALNQQLFKLVMLISYFVVISGCFYKLLTRNRSKYKVLNGNATLHFVQWPSWTVMSLNDYIRDRMNNNLGMHELMKYEWGRLESFKSYPLKAPLSPLKLARAGFYYTGENQTVKCFCCGEQYDANDYEELNGAHQRNSRNCSFARGERSSNIPIQHSGRSNCINFGRREHQYLPLYRYLDHVTEAFRLPSLRALPRGRLDIAGFYYTGSQHHHLRRLGSLLELLRMSLNSLHIPPHNSESNTGHRQETMSSEHISCEMRTRLAQRLLQMGFTEDRISDALNFFRSLGINELDVNDALDHITTTEPNYDIRGFSIYPMNATNIRLDRNESSQIELEQRTDTGVQFMICDADDDILIVCEGMEGVAMETPDAAKDKSQPENTNLLSAKSEIITNENKAGSGISTADETPKKNFEENEILKNQLTCKICMDKAANIVFIPCGHMISCETCAPHIRKCAICRKLIDGRVKMFMS